MACSVYRILNDHGTLDQDALAAAFAAHHDFDRGYGPATTPVRTGSVQGVVIR
jgi:hypothetical protein